MSIRLINTTTLRLEWFMGHKIPDYAILSHTWDPTGEVSFQEMVAISENPDHPAAKKSGYAKIVKTCQKAAAAKERIPYAWVDTCCIDKTSSSELSEAINTMYRYYQKAKVCYAVLGDFDKESSTIESALPRCRWFTRGWCLQELIAPPNVEFFDGHWNPIGSKASLTSQISKITRIDERVLRDRRLIGSIPVACKMSWAAGRETTREEDMAYCLLGIFDVNMPMLYGEGHKAFMRLQEEIIKTSNDLSIFAFLQGPTSHLPGPSLGPALELSQPYCDLFATSPQDFINCGNLVYAGNDIPWNVAFALTNKGLHFRRVRLQVDFRHGSYSIPLNYNSSGSTIARMYLRKVGPSLFVRYDNRSTEARSEMDSDDYDDYTEVEEAYIITKITPSMQLQLKGTDEYAIHVWSHNYDLSKALQVMQRTVSSDSWDVSRMLFLIKGAKSSGCYLKVFPSLARRAAEVENDHQIPSGHFYLVFGLERPELSSNPRALVRLYSLEEWRALEKRLGIITSLNDVIGTKNANYTSDRTILGTSSTNSTTITASIKLESKEGRPSFELELKFKKEPAAETVLKANPTTEATPITQIAAVVEDVLGKVNPKTKDSKLA